MDAPKLILEPVLSLGENQTPQQIFVGQAHDLPVALRGALHRHRHYEVMWLSQDGATFFSDFHRYPLPTGTLTFVAPGQLHAWQGDWHLFDLTVISFTPSLWTAHQQDPQPLPRLPFFLPMAVPHLIVPDDQQALFHMLFTTIHRRYQSDLQGQEQLLLYYLQLILAEAQQLYGNAGTPAELSAATQLTQNFRYRVEQHYRERLKVQDYAALLGVTTNHLVKAVGSVTGKSPGVILQERLALEAKRLLIHTTAPIAEIAAELAFSNPTQFGTWFKLREQLSPGQFRQQFHLRHG